MNSAPLLEDDNREPQTSTSELIPLSELPTCRSCGTKVDPSRRLCQSCEELPPEEKQRDVDSSSDLSAEAPASREDMAVRIGDRLIFDFTRQPSWSKKRKTGLSSRVKNELPVELSAVNISSEVWHEWIQELEEIQANAPTTCCFLATICCPVPIVQAGLCTLFCPLNAKHCLSWLPCCFGDWHDGLRGWMYLVNDTLNQHGMHVKFLTYPEDKAPHSKLVEQRREDMSFLVISLNQDETDILQEEPWDHTRPKSQCRCLIDYGTVI